MPRMFCTNAQRILVSTATLWPVIKNSMNVIGISNSPAHVAGSPPNNYAVVSPAAAEDYEDDSTFMPDGSVVGTFNPERPAEVDELFGDLHDEAHEFIVDIRDESGASKARKAKSALGHLDDFLKNVFQSQNQSEFQRDYVSWVSCTSW